MKLRHLKRFSPAVFTLLAVVILLMAYTFMKEWRQPAIAHIQAQKIKENGNTVEWRWTITGDRKWYGISFSSANFIVLETGGSWHWLSGWGSKVWTYDLTVQHVGGSINAPMLNECIRLSTEHGLFGRPIFSTQKARQKPLNQLVHVIETKDLGCVKI